MTLSLYIKQIENQNPYSSTANAKLGDKDALHSLLCTLLGFWHLSPPEAARLHGLRPSSPSPLEKPILLLSRDAWQRRQGAVLAHSNCSLAQHGQDDRQVT